MRDRAERLVEAGCCLAEAVQLEGAGKIHGKDQRRHRHRQGAGIDKAEADPNDRKRACDEGKVEQMFIHWFLVG